MPRRSRSQAAQDVFLGLGVDARETIVEDQHRRRPDQPARERRALLLSARQRDAALPDRSCRAHRAKRSIVSLQVGGSPAADQISASLAFGIVVAQVVRAAARRTGTDPAAPAPPDGAAARAESRGRRGRRSNNVPGGGSSRRTSSFSSVVLPAPTRPRIAIDLAVRDVEVDAGRSARAPG